MVLSTLHTNDAASTPVRLLDMGVPRYMVATSLNAVLAQRLVRVVCESCATEYQPLPSEQAWLDMELGANAPPKRYLTGRGCTQCNGTGFAGRVGVYEMLEMTPQLVDAVSHHDPNHFVKVARQDMAGWSLRRHAVALAAAGRTTVAEAMRVSNVADE
jgi:MSHA biogenesis protein MshE